MITKVVHTGAESATGQSQAFTNLGEKLLVSCDVTAITAGSLDISVEWSPDGTNWGAPETAMALSQFTGTGVKSEDYPSAGPFYRIVWTIVTGPATFTVATQQ